MHNGKLRQYLVNSIRSTKYLSKYVSYFRRREIEEPTAIIKRKCSYDSEKPFLRLVQVLVDLVLQVEECFTVTTLTIIMVINR